MEHQYLKFRKIYNFTKSRGMYSEQNDYYYLMQKYFERTNRLSTLHRYISKLYRILSNYGQSIIKPTLWLILIWVMSAIFYLFLIQNDYNFTKDSIISESFLLSMQQIIKPYNLLLDNSKNIKIYILGFLESSLSITLITLLILALRANFKRH